MGETAYKGEAMPRILDFDRALGGKGGSGCKLCDILADLDPEDAEDLRGLLPVRSGSHIARLLTEFGYPIGRSTVSVHRAQGHA